MYVCNLYFVRAYQLPLFHRCLRLSGIVNLPDRNVEIENNGVFALCYVTVPRSESHLLFELSQRFEGYLSIESDSVGEQ